MLDKAPHGSRFEQNCVLRVNVVDVETPAQAKPRLTQEGW